MHSLVDSGSKVVRSSRGADNIALKKRGLYLAAAESAERLLVAPVNTVDFVRGFS